ncbi:unnamed protein product [Clonostachys solani]|uniref:Uncharacterized protein n=1 Tax=Clonostachys solani TaxID=160281 RepID=A0A9N9W3N0_9HYPO|nr:unnamed protein product [Clonostachys solani]
MDLWVAILTPCYGRVKALVRQGADLTEADPRGETPLTFASRLASPDMVKILLKAGADPDSDPSFPLNAALENGRLVSAKALLKAGANINRVDPSTGTPLMYAVLQNHMHIVMFLLRNGADINATNADGRSALHEAASAGLLIMVVFLTIHGADLCATAPIRHNPSHYSAPFTPLAHAAHYGHFGIVTYLVERMEAKGVTAGDRGLALCTAAGSGFVDIVNLLLEHGWDKMEPPRGSPPLLFAIAKKKRATVDILLPKGADIHATLGPEEKTALHLAAAWGETRLLRNFIRQGANVDARTKIKGKTPLHVASQNRYPVYGLKAARALLNAGADIASCTNDGRNILHLAASVGNVPLLRRALRHGLDPDSKTGRGLTPLAIAAEHGQLRSIDILLRLGASTDARCDENCTPLHLAAAQGQWRAVGFLIENGAGLDLLNSRGYSPLQEARENLHNAAEIVLLQAGAAENPLPEKS